MTKSMNDLSKTSQYDRQSNEEYDSEESGYVASQIGGSYQDQIHKIKFHVSSDCSQVLLSWKFSKILIGRLWKWRQHVFATAFTPKYKISLACFWLRRDSFFWQDCDLIRISVQSEPTAHSKRIKLSITGPAAWFYADEVCLASNESSIV